jgi:DNA-binding CsgD family transcriptional regulator
MKGYGSVDPLITEGLRQAAPFDWSDLIGRDPAVDAFFADVAEHGIGPIGISIPCTSLGAKIGLVSLTFDCPAEAWPALRRAHLPDWIMAANILHQIALDAEGLNDPESVRLTERERECLIWAALGKTDEDIATILGISRWTVVAHFQSAKFKLKSLNRTGAVAAALRIGAISAD